MTSKDSKDKKEDNKELDLQQKYMEFQAIENRLKQFEGQIQQIEQQIQEVAAISQSLSEIKEVEEGKEILFPLANGIFAKASLKSLDKLVVTVGSNVAVEKDVEGTRKLLEEQTEELVKYRIQMENNIKMLSERLQELSKEMKA